MHSRLNYYAKRSDMLFQLANNFDFKDPTCPTTAEWNKRNRMYTEAIAFAAVLGDIEANLCPLLKELRNTSLPMKAAGMLKKILRDFDWAKEQIYDEQELEDMKLEERRIS